MKAFSSAMALACLLVGLPSPRLARADPPRTDTGRTDTGRTDTTVATAALGPAAAPEAVERQAAGLLADVERVVAAETSIGWIVDEAEFEDMYPALMRSTCRTLPQARQIALGALERERQRLGDPKALFVAAGRELDADVEAALVAERRLMALQKALRGAAKDCPFWIEVDPEFQGLQTDRNRFTLNVESGGVAILRETASAWTLGAGGFGRVLSAYGFNGQWTLLAGPEFGGAALVRPAESNTDVTIHYFPAVPVIARLRDVAWHYDLELAPVGLLQADDTNLSYGMRVATTVGLSALYTTGVIPWAGVSLAYEYYLESGDRPVAHFIRFGFRAGVSWDP